MSSAMLSAPGTRSRIEPAGSAGSPKLGQALLDVPEHPDAARLEVEQAGQDDPGGHDHDGSREAGEEAAKGEEEHQREGGQPEGRASARVRAARRSPGPAE